MATTSQGKNAAAAHAAASKSRQARPPAGRGAPARPITLSTPAANARQDRSGLSGPVAALSARRLAVLTGLFVLAIGALLTFKLQDEAQARRVETELRVAQAASDCAGALDIAAVTGGSAGEAFARCHPGGAAALYHLSSNGDVLASYGAAKKVFLDAAAARSLPLNRRGQTVMSLGDLSAQMAWRPLDQGGAVLAAAPAKDIYQRTPLWLAYVLIAAAIALVTGSLLAAFVQQSKTAARAAGALQALSTVDGALAAGRCCAWRYDSAARTVMLTRALLEPLGLGPRDRQFTLRELSALIHPNDLRDALAIFTGDTSGVTEGAVRLRRPDGAWSRVYVRTAAASPGRARGARAGVAIDLSGAPSISAGAAIAEARLKDAIECIPEAFVLWDAQGRLAAWNRRFASIFKLPAGALAHGLSAEEVAKKAKAGGMVITQYFGPHAPLDEQSVEVALKGDRWLQISRRRTAEGGLVCIASNVTDMKRRARAQKRKERILQDAVADLQSSRRTLSETMEKYEHEKHRAEEASRSKSEFLANMSHELRTPLNAINGFSEIMQSELYGPLGDEKYKEYVSDILASGQHLLELIDDILDMSKIEAGKLHLEPSKVDLERVLAESARLVAKRAKDAGIDLTLSVAHAPAVWADARAIKQVVLNLLSNAVKFTGENGEVTLTAQADLDGVTVIVADSGTGIAPENLKKLGAPFEVSESYASKTRTGSGLGLALSKSLMELQSGILAIASQEGRGTVACATFPRRSGATVRLPHFIGPEAQILTHPSLNTAREASANKASGKSAPRPPRAATRKPTARTASQAAE